MLQEVVTWLKTIDLELEGKISAGGIDGNRERYVGVYTARQQPPREQICVGGLQSTRAQEQRLTILVHWTKNAVTAEKKATELYNKLRGLSACNMGGITVYRVDPGGGPLPVGKDQHGVIEYVINLKIIYERKE